MAKTRLLRVWLSGVALALALAPSARADLGLLVVSNANSRVVHYYGNTGAFEGVVIPAGTGELSQPGGSVIGPDGRLYLSVPGAVKRYDAANGAFIDTFVSGLPTGGPGELGFGPDGNLYGTLGTANLWFKADGSTGTLLGTFGGGGLNSAVGLDFGPDGNLYVGSFLGKQVLRFNPTTGAFVDVFAAVPNHPNTGYIGCVRFGPDGNLYVSLPNASDNDIWRFDATTGASLGSFIPPGDPHPPGPRLFRWGPDGNLYVPARDSAEVLRYNGTTGAFIDHFAHSRALSGPYSVAFAPEPIHGEGQPPPIDTTSGPVQGLFEQGVFKYQGVPYAEAPTGSLRWKRPVRKAASPTPLDATGFGSMCPQLSGSTAVGDEDCLEISLWQPPKDPNAPPLPVLFYIHGGGLVTGSAAWLVTDGTSFASSQNVIVAEAQYRLGALGFFGRPGLAAEDPNGSTGNYGFLDQLEALRWVRDNVAVFGGDPNQITIAGQSAGGWSVCALMASPLSDGLFRAGIVQSGQCYNARALADLPAGSPVLGDPYFGSTIYKRSAAIATDFNVSCGADDLVCLREKSAASLVQALGAQPKVIGPDPPANPAIDGYFLPEQPLGLLRQGAADHRPLMIGSVANESTYFTRGLENIITSPAIYDLFARSALGNTRTDALETVYPATNVPSVYPTWAEEMRVLFDDAGVVCPTLDTADAIAQGGSPAWVYHLTFPPDYSLNPANADLRSFHTLDLYYVFGTYARLAADYGITTGPNDTALSTSMQDAWGSFVRTGVPSTTPAWPVYAPTTPGDLASVSVMLFDAPNSTISGNLFRSGRCAALVPVANQLDPDRDVATSDEDNCPVTTNTSQADAELDSVGDACDNCVNVANPRVASDFLTQNPWATLTGGQRDDDHDGYGNKCDAKFPGVPGLTVNTGDLTAFRASNAKNRTTDTCGTTGTQPCAIWDLDETGLTINTGDLAQFRLLNTRPPGPKCPSCPLACTAGTAGACPATP